MRAVLISINKPHTDDIFSGEKILEWRKKPLPVGRHYVYETKNKGGCGMVIGEMIITGSKAVDTSRPLEVCLVNAGRIHPATLKQYANNGIVYANFITDAKRYDEPMDVHWLQKPSVPGDFWPKDVSIRRPPQSWCYVEEMNNG
jgi:hypothetical protein